MTNFGTYLKNARRGAKRTQSDVAEALGKSRGTVIAIEQGKVLPKNVMEVVRLAKFLRLDELEAISNYAEAKMFEGEDERAESASEKGQGFFGGMAATVARLQGRRNDERENEIVEVSPKSNEQIEDRVSGIVLSVVDEQEYERGGLPIVGIMQSEQRLNEIAQESGVRYPVRFEVADDSEWWEASTVFEDDALTVYVRDDVFCRADEGRGRDRWTMSHELGHVVLHGNQLARSSSGRMFRDYGQTPSEAARSHGIPPYRSPEHQAQIASAAMLMPSELVVRFCHKRDREGFDLVDAVAEHFGVSQQAAQIRLSTLSHKLVGDSEEEVPW